MPAYSQVHLRGEVAERPYFDLVPVRHHDEHDRIAFLRVLIWVQRDTDQPPLFSCVSSFSSCLMTSALPVSMQFTPAIRWAMSPPVRIP
jgi:hypothetical protein